MSGISIKPNTDLTSITSDWEHWDKEFLSQDKRLQEIFSSPIVPNPNEVVRILTERGISVPDSWQKFTPNPTTSFTTGTAALFATLPTTTKPTQNTSTQQTPTPITSTPHATTQQACDHIKDILKYDFSMTRHSLGLLLDPCVGESVQYNVSTVLMMAFLRFTEGMAFSPAAAREALNWCVSESSQLEGSDLEQVTKTLYTNFNRIYERNIGTQYAQAESFRLLREDLTAAGSGKYVPSTPQDLFNPPSCLFAFAHEFLQAHDEAYESLEALDDTVTMEKVTDGIGLRISRLKQAETEQISNLTPETMYDAVALFQDYGPAREKIYQELGITEQQVIQAQNFLTQKSGHWEISEVAKSRGIWVNEPKIKPSDIDNKTWELALTLAKRKNELESTSFYRGLGESGTSVASAVLVGKLGTWMELGTLWNPIIAGFAAVTAVGAFGVNKLNESHDHLQFAKAARDAHEFTGSSWGSDAVVAHLDRKQSAEVKALFINSIIASASGGASGLVSHQFAKRAVARVVLQSSLGAAGNTASILLDENKNNQAVLNEDQALAGRPLDQAPTVGGYVFNAAVIGFIIGGGFEAATSVKQLSVEWNALTNVIRFMDPNSGLPLETAAVGSYANGLLDLKLPNSTEMIIQIADEGHSAVAWHDPLAEVTETVPRRFNSTFSDAADDAQDLGSDLIDENAYDGLSRLAFGGLDEMEITSAIPGRITPESIDVQAPYNPPGEGRFHVTPGTAEPTPAFLKSSPPPPSSPAQSEGTAPRLRPQTPAIQTPRQPEALNMSYATSSGRLGKFKEAVSYLQNKESFLQHLEETTYALRRFLLNGKLRQRESDLQNINIPTTYSGPRLYGEFIQSLDYYQQQLEFLVASKDVTAAEAADIRTALHDLESSIQSAQPSDDIISNVDPHIPKPTE